MKGVRKSKVKDKKNDYKNGRRLEGRMGCK